MKKQRLKPDIIPAIKPSVPSESSSAVSSKKSSNGDVHRKNIASTYDLDKLALDSFYPANHNKKRVLSKLSQHKIPRQSIKEKVQIITEDIAHDSPSDEYNFAGDVIVRKGPTPKLLENTFAASITAVKPSRRVANVLPAQVAQ